MIYYECSDCGQVILKLVDQSTDLECCGKKMVSLNDILLIYNTRSKYIHFIKRSTLVAEPMVN